YQAGAGGQEEAALQAVPCGAGYPRQCRPGESSQGNPGDRTGQCGRGERPQVRGSCRDRRTVDAGGLPQPQIEALPQGSSGRAEAGKGQCERPISEVPTGKSSACQ